ALQDPSVRVVQRLKISSDPVRVLLAPDGSSCVVASLWSRRLSFVAIASERVDPVGKKTGLPLQLARVLDLPFCPRNLAWVRGGTGAIAPVPSIMQPFRTFSPRNSLESPSREGSSLAS